MSKTEFREFYLCKTDEHDGLCYQLRGKESAPNKVPNGNINMINEISSNNGIAKKATSDNVFRAPAITVSVNFAKNVFYQTEDFCASVNVLILKGDWMQKYPSSCLYFCTLLRKLHEKYDYNHKISKEKLNETKLLLPIKKVQNIDFDYIQGIMRGGQAMLNKLDTSGWKEFRLGDLFDIDNWQYGKNKQYKTRLDKQTDNSLPVISGITINNGVNYYTEDLCDELEIFEDSLTISTRGEYSGTVFYHKGQFVLANNILVMTMPGLSEDVKLFLGTCISKLGYGGYSGYPTKETLKENIIKLPVKETEEIDFEYMEKYINIQKKLVIKDVVQLKDRIIEETKKVVAG